MDILPKSITIMSFSDLIRPDVHYRGQRTKGNCKINLFLRSTPKVDYSR